MTSKTPKQKSGTTSTQSGDEKEKPDQEFHHETPHQHQTERGKQ